MFRKVAIGFMMALGLTGATLSLSPAQAAAIPAGSGAALADMGGSPVQPVWHHRRSYFGFGFGLFGGPGYWSEPYYYGPRYYYAPRCHWETRKVRRKGRWVRVSRRVCW